MSHDLQATLLHTIVETPFLKQSLKKSPYGHH